MQFYCLGARIKMQNTTSPVITQKQNQDAQILSSKLNDVRQRKRAYVDFTGAFYAADYLQSFGLRANMQRSVFKCSKLYLDFEIVDIYCNSHMIYVLTAYASETVKVPMMHRQYGIVPESYIVVNLKAGLKEAEIKGIIEPADFETAQNDGKYYTFNINNLKPIDSLIQKVRKYAGIKSSIGRHLDCMSLFVPYVDNKLDNAKKKQLIEHVLTCETCKKRLIETVEFDNKSKGIENYGAILSKEDLSTKDNFIKKIANAEKEGQAGLKGAIDVIYEGKEFNNIKEEAFKYKTDIPPKAKKLVLLTFSVIVTLFILVIFAFNIPIANKAPINDEAAEGTVYAGDLGTALNESGDDFDLTVPKINKNKSYATVSKVSWEVSSNVTKEDQKKFLQQVGKSIRLNLQNDLLLSNEVALNNRVKFDIRFLRDGNIESITVSESSGTKAVDEIIRQSIENTMYYMRPPKGSFVGKKNGLTLVINF